MRFALFLLLATSVLVTVSIPATRFPDGAVEPGPCRDTRDSRPVIVPVPANGKTVVSLEDLVARSTGIAGCDDQLSTGATLSVEQVGQGSLSLPGVNPRQVAFIPRRGFSGMSGVWTLVLRDEAGNELRSVRVTFEVRNSVPVAVDDEIVAPLEASRLDVGPAMGVLANDIDDNGDHLVVYSQGVTSFPWGTVTLHGDGSYRITVTDRALLRPAQVRYLVWDQQGSPTSVDQGVLSIDFKDAVVAED